MFYSILIILDSDFQVHSPYQKWLPLSDKNEIFLETQNLLFPKFFKTTNHSNGIYETGTLTANEWKPFTLSTINLSHIQEKVVHYKKRREWFEKSKNIYIQ